MSERLAVSYLCMKRLMGRAFNIFHVACHE